MVDITTGSPKLSETEKQKQARALLSSECLSATVLTNCTRFPAPPVNEMIAELRRQSMAVNRGDMSKPESMLVAQAHALEGLFANPGKKHRPQKP